MELNIKINGTDRYAILSVKDKNNIERKKTVLLEDVVGLLSEQFSFSTDILPRGTRLYCGNKRDYNIIIEMPSMVRLIMYQRQEDTLVCKIPFPICLFSFSILDSNIYSSNVYCLKNSINTKMDKLYKFPFGNVYDTNKICWGGNNFDKIEIPQDLFGIINIFYDSKFNGDLFNTSLLNESLNITNVKDLFLFLKDKEKFPIDVLKSCNKTFCDLMEKTASQ
jgi:hypothetical protein